jgi:hypothetical protein
MILFNYFPKAELTIASDNKIHFHHKRASLYHRENKKVSKKIRTNLDEKSFRVLMRAFEALDYSNTTDETTSAINQKLI